MTARPARTARRTALVGLLALAPAVGLVATASSSSAAAGPVPQHLGDPRAWGPPLGALCDLPLADAKATASAAGYVVHELTNGGDTFSGTPQPDAIFALGGNDRISGGAGDDVICLSFGHDEGRGQDGNDAVFGEEHDDALLGGQGRDHLDGGPQNDTCGGGPGLDSLVDC